MKADRFDILVLAAVCLIGTAAAALALTGGGDAAMPVPAAVRMKAAPPDPSVYIELDRLRTLVETGQAGEALEPLGHISGSNPAMSAPHALMGEAYARLLDYPAAMREYRTALAMDPEYVDRKSERFIGKRIKSAVREGMAGAKAALAKDPADKAARAALKDAYYIERMLAGGCE